MIECPHHEGAFDCTVFCQLCEGENEYNPADTLPCNVLDCNETIRKDIWAEELGFCVECSHDYHNGKLDPFTFERL